MQWISGDYSAPSSQAAFLKRKRYQKTNKCMGMTPHNAKTLGHNMLSANNTRGKAFAYVYKYNYNLVKGTVICKLKIERVRQYRITFQRSDYGYRL